MSVVNSIAHNSKSEGEVAEPDGNTSDITFAFPGPDKPLIMKLVKDPFTGKSCVKIDSFKHMIGNTDKDTRNHPCRDSLGLGSSPEKDYFWELISKLKTLREEGKKDTEEYEAVIALKKKFSPRAGGYVLYVEPGSPKIKALKVGPMFFNRLFGRKKTDWSAEVPSLVKQLSAKNKSAYLDVDNEVNKTGWIKTWRTGERLATEYHNEPCTVEVEKVIEGEEVTVTKYIEYNLNDEIKAILAGEKELDLTAVPDVIEFEKKQAWTLEESQILVDADGALEGTPEKLLKKDAGLEDEGTETDSEVYKTTTVSGGIAGGGVDTDPTASLDDIPF